MQYLRQSTASQEVILGPFLDDTDGKTSETALSIANTDIKVWKTGGTTESSKNSGGATHIASGRYYAVLDATDTNTIGPLEINVHVSGALPVKLRCCVLDEAVYDVLFGTTAPSTYAGSDTSGTTTLLSRIGSALTITSGRVNADITHIATAAVSASTAQLGVNVVNFGGSAGTFASGRPDVNTTHAAGTAWGSGAITAASIAAAALNGKGDWNVGKTGYSLTATTGLGNQTSDITGNLSGSVGSVTGAVGSVTGLTVANLDAAISSRMATYTQPTGFLAATFPATVASTTNITAGTITTVTNLTNLPAITTDWMTGTGVAASAVTKIQAGLATPTNITAATGITVSTNNDKTGYSLTQTFPANFSALDINASGHVSRVVLCDTITTYTGNTVQTGDSFARIGATGSGLTSLAPSATALSTATWTPTRAGYIDNLSAGAVATASNLAIVAGYLDTEIAAIKAVTDKLDTALELDSTVYRFTVNALENAPSGGGGGLDAAGVRAAIGLASANLDTQLSTIDTVVDSILVDTAEIGAAGAGLTAINLPNQTMDIIGNITGNLSGSVGSVTTKTGYSLADGSIVSATFGAGATIPRCTLVDTTTTNTDMRGTDSAATAANLAIVAGYLDTEIAAILEDTGTTIPAQISALNNLSSAQAQTAAAAALTSYDPPTNAEMEARTILAASYATASSISALNNLSAAQVNAEVDQALADYDSPTNAEMVARTLAAASYGTAANQTTIISHLTDVKGATFSEATDSLEAIRDRGDSSWTTATGFAVVGDIPTADQNAAALMDLANGVETGLTPRQALRLLTAALAGELSGAATTTITIRNTADTKNRITATVDADGNRTAITYDVS